jgi:phage N-6-adenine-methyltransferase
MMADTTSIPSAIRTIYSSQSVIWETPQTLFDQLNRVFRFEYDVCALPQNAKCAQYFTPAMDGLQQDWHGACWMNPPYGRTLGLWVKKAYESARHNLATVVCLLPVRADTRWWHEYCRQGEVTFIKGRLRFSNAKHSAPFASAVVVFRPKVEDALEHS